LLAEKATILRDVMQKVMHRYPHSTADMKVWEQYRNMKSVLDEQPNIINYAKEAIQRIGIKPNLGSIRGGTDGSRLSFMGLPCPNLFAAQNAIHSRHEWISVQDMQKAVDTIIEICRVWEEKS
jgi:tripeptide aminopeptidase